VILTASCNERGINLPISVMRRGLKFKAMIYHCEAHYRAVITIKRKKPHLLAQERQKKDETLKA